MTAHADLAITASRVWLGPDKWTHALAVGAGRVIAHGDAVTGLIGPRTEHLHAVGELVVPGFQDAHLHAPQAGRNLSTIDLHDLPGRSAYLERIAGYAAANPDAQWLVGGGWAMEHFPGGTPHRDDLDSVTGERPAFLFNRDVHGAWLNSAALRIGGIDKDTPDPSDGRYEREPDGTPTGMLHEGAAYTFESRFLPMPTRSEWEAAILRAQAYLHSLGITGWQDAWVSPQTQDAYRSLVGADKLTARVVGSLWWDRHRGLDQIDELRERRTAGGGNFLPTTVKIMVDGIVENGTSSMLEPFSDGCGGHTDNHGLDYVPRELLAEAVTQLDALGFQVHMHTIGDRAVRNALDAVEAARSANGPSDNRHHLAHVQVIHPDDVVRFGPLGVVANCQTFWAQHEPQMNHNTIPMLGADRAQLQYPFAALAGSGARLAMGSDWPVTTPDPLLQMEVAIRRIDPEHRDNDPFLPDQRLSPEAALTGFTAGTAYVNHDEQGGSLEIGRRADLAVLDHDIFGMDGRISDARVVCTVAGGALVHPPR
jgi:predicted amidohydrolase YtcJ